MAKSPVPCLDFPIVHSSLYYQYNVYDLKGPMNIVIHGLIGHVHTSACRALVHMFIYALLRMLSLSLWVAGVGEQ
jgi:hypothetical protein